MESINPAFYTFESIRAFLLANDIPTKDALREILRYDPDAKEIHWTRFVRDGSGWLMLGPDTVLTESMVTPVKDGQEPKHHLVAQPRQPVADVAPLANIKAKIFVQINDGEPKEVGSVDLPIHGDVSINNSTATLRVDSEPFVAATTSLADKLRRFIASL